MTEQELLVEFTSICSELVALAERIDEDHWAKHFFRPALKALQDTHSPVKQRLEKAYDYTGVFGGMGSWNDSPSCSARLYNESANYDRLSNLLSECRTAVASLDRTDQ